MHDRDLLQRAIDVAIGNVAGGGGPFGAVVARAGVVVAVGGNRVTADLDPTAHAEIQAIRHACRELGTFSLEGCVLYASCEPCPMCWTAAHWARLDRIVFAADRNDAAAADFDDAVLHDELARPVARRRMPMRQLRLPAAGAPFAAWRALTDKTPY